VNQAALPDPGVAFLARLLSLSEKFPDRTRPASASPNYDGLRSAEMVARFQAQMLAAQRAGAITLRNGKRERRHLIERVTVQDAAVLARHLGRRPAAVVAREVRAVLEAVAEGAESWVLVILQDMEGRWSRGEPALRLSADDIDQAKEFFMLLAAISRDQAHGLDGRTFSLRATGDTKAFDRHSGRLASVLARRFEDPNMDPELVWSRIGLERFGHPVHVRGCVLVEDQDGVLVHGRAMPFASIHPEMLPLLRLCGQPTLVLTIENYASFNRYVREVDDGALVIYTGGFASAGVVQLLNALLSMLDAAVPLFHWGDVDPGGLRIFRFLEEALTRRPLPHLMTQTLAKTHGRGASADVTLSSIARSDSALAPLAEWLARGDEIKHLEQEAIDPISPAGTVASLNAYG